MAKKIRQTLLAALVLALCCPFLVPAQAAAVTGLVLVGAFPTSATIVEDVADDQGNYSQSLSVDEGVMMLTTLRQKVDDQHPMGVEFSRFLSAYYPNRNEVETLSADPVAAYPAERMRFLIGGNEDTEVVDALLIRTDEHYFAFFVEVNADTYYGYRDDYPEGEIPALIDGWVQSLDLFDPNAPI